MVDVVRRPEFAVSLPLGPDAASAAVEAERLGFDHVSCGEHVSFHQPTANGFVTLAAAAGATDQIGLFSAVTLVPLYPPVLLAKLVAALDDVSGGRFTLGVGVGGEFPPEFNAVGVPVRERGARTDESLEVLVRLLASAPATYAGRFSAFTNLTIAPCPATLPPLWIAGRGAAAIQRAVRFGDGWVPYMFSPERLAAGCTELRKMLASYGRPPDDVRLGIHLFTTVLPDGTDARAKAVEVVSQTYAQNFDSLANRYLLFGTPQECRDRLQAYRDAGADTFILRLAGDSADRSIMLRTLAEEVVAPLRTQWV